MFLRGSGVISEAKSVPSHAMVGSNSPEEYLSPRLATPEAAAHPQAMRRFRRVHRRLPQGPPTYAAARIAPLGMVSAGD